MRGGRPQFENKKSPKTSIEMSMIFKYDRVGIG
jgi:hypothetical protein